MRKNFCLKTLSCCLCAVAVVTMNPPILAEAKTGFDIENVTAGAASVLDIQETIETEFSLNEDETQVAGADESVEVVENSMTTLLASNSFLSVSNVLSESNLWGYTNLGIANVDNNLNVREEPDKFAKMVGKLPKEAACEILEIEGEWAHIQSGEVEGYVSTEFLFLGKDAVARAKEIVSLYANVTTETLKVREQPNTECVTLTLVPKGEKLEAVRVLDNGWVEILIDDETAYVSGEFVDVQEQLDTAITMTELLYGQGVSDVRVSLCQFAKQYLGNPYVWGGTSLTKGADCSGFVLSVFKNYGITLPHHAASQACCGTKIDMDSIQPGDLVFYSKNGSINHVAIYIGSGQVIHASSPKTGIKISNVYYRTPAKVVRIL